jgi:arylsulfatase A-like enzyme
LESLENRLCPATRPNIVLINTDDQRADTLPFMSTTVQELVDSGTTFANNFVPTSLCCPSRASLLTGDYAHNHGVLGNDPPTGSFFNFDDSSTLATWLHDAGYHTGLYGKYLNAYGWYYLNSSFESYIPPGWDEWHAFSGNTTYYNYILNDNGVKDVYGSTAADYSTDVLAAKATDFIRNATSQTNPQQPFFLYFSPYAAHDNNNNHPPTPAPRDIGKLAGLAPYRPSNFNAADASDKPSWAGNLGLLGTNAIAAIDAYREAQLETLLAVDDAVGSFVAALCAAGAYDNTIIIYTSDNGLEWGEHRLRETKSSPYEESLRVPLIIRDGRHPGQQMVNGMSLNIDLAPTIMDLTGLPIPAHVDGRSLVPLLNGQTSGWRTEFLVENWDGAGPPSFNALRTDRWKYVEYSNGERELYDLVNDPYELQNLQADPGQAALMADLSARMHALMASDKQGPLTINVGLNARLINKGSLTVTATASDVTTGGSNVRTPELFIDQIGRDFTGTPMIITGYPNAKLDSPTEAFTRILGSGQIAALSEGLHTIYIHARDVAGNWGPYVATTFIKDSIAPITSALVVTPSLTNAGPLVLSGVVSDITSGASPVARAEYFIDTQGAPGGGRPLAAVDGVFNSAAEAVTATLSASVFAALADGTHVLYVRGRDAANNWGPFASICFTKDTHGPATSNLAITPGLANAGPLTVTGTVSDASLGGSHILAAEYFIDLQGKNGNGTRLRARDGVFDTATEGISGTLTAAVIAPLADGVHKIYLHGQDAAGNWGAFVTLTFTKDTRGPSVSQLVVNPALAKPGPLALSVTVSDIGAGGNNVAAAEYFLDSPGASGSGFALAASDGSYNSPTEAVSGTIAASAFAVLADGTHVVYVHGRDVVGNWGPFGQVAFAKDTQGPLASSLTVNPGLVSSGPIAGSATLSDAISSVAAVEFFFDMTVPNGSGTPLAAGDGAFNSASESISGLVPASEFAALADGPPLLYVHARDAAGNWGGLAAIPFTKDSPGPVASSLSIKPVLTNVGPLLISGTLTDQIAPVSAAEYFLHAVGVPDAGTPLAAADGAFVSDSEAVSGNVPADDLMTLTDGARVLYVHGRDVAGNREGFASVAFTKDSHLNDGGPDQLLSISGDGKDDYRTLRLNAGDPTVLLALNESTVIASRRIGGATVTHNELAVLRSVQREWTKPTVLPHESPNSVQGGTDYIDWFFASSNDLIKDPDPLAGAISARP